MSARRTEAVEAPAEPSAAALDARVRALEAALEAERARVERLRSSFSWRVTLPFRAVRRAWERATGRSSGSPAAAAADAADRRRPRLQWCVDHPRDWSALPERFSLKGWVFRESGPRVVAVRLRVGEEVHELPHGLRREEIGAKFAAVPGASASGFLADEIPRPAEGELVVLEARAEPGPWEPFFTAVVGETRQAVPRSGGRRGRVVQPSGPVVRWCIDHPQRWEEVTHRMDLKGWVFVEGERLGGLRVWIGSAVFPLPYPVVREDIAAAFPSVPEARESGFFVTELPVPARQQLLVIEAQHADGAWRPFFRHEVRAAAAPVDEPPAAAARPGPWRATCGPWDRRGFHWDDLDEGSAYVKEAAWWEAPVALAGGELCVRGRVLDLRGRHRTVTSIPRLSVAIPGGGPEVVVAPETAGPFEVRVPLPPRGLPAGARVECRLGGVAWTNALAWLARVSAPWPMPRAWRLRLEEHRRQHPNRQVRLDAVAVDGEVVADFRGHRVAPPHERVRKLWQPGINLHGFFRAEFGIGESVRCMARAAEAAGIPLALVDLRVPSSARMGDVSYVRRLRGGGDHPVNVFHLDAPQAEELDHHHPGVRRGRYNIAYLAWELPEFPDAWVRHVRFFDEVWVPSEFVRVALAAKLPQPVVAIPHCVTFEIPDPAGGRARLGLPEGPFLFLFVWDLASTAARKNPRAAVEAYRRAFGGGRSDVGLVLKTHNVARYPEAYAELKAAVAGLEGVILMTETLPRPDVYRLIQACDAFVSLHRAEGFGLAVAEAMYLGRPVVSTDWSATAEFVNEENGCPVRSRLVTIEETVGPYARGQVWAEADVEHAAEWMRRLAEDRTLAARLGEAAGAYVRERLSPEMIGQRYRARLAAMVNW